ncbi:MAG: hypothetical protein N3D84_00080 [Candidatus Woesearchaeota archaeon]|nr:hypothetical protein [Candidatus Woesearchaeota archaeon]
MKRPLICMVCGKNPAISTCAICGRVACNDCINGSSVCMNCKIGRRIR